MLSILKRIALAGTVVMLVVMAFAQVQRQTEVLSVHGYEGRADVIRDQGRVFVDAQELARITNGSLSFENDRIVLTLPRTGASDSEIDGANEPAFSRPFINAAIEAMASIREWGGTLLARHTITK